MTTWQNEAGARLRPALVAFAFLWACDDGGENLQDNTPPAVAQVTVSAPATAVAVGETLQLHAVTLDAEGDSLDDRTVEWASASTAVATVSESGMVTGLSAGEAQLRRGQ